MAVVSRGLWLRSQPAPLASRPDVSLLRRTICPKCPYRCTLGLYGGVWRREWRAASRWKWPVRTHAGWAVQAVRFSPPQGHDRPPSGQFLVLPEQHISGRHAVIRYSNGTFYVVDTSSNGVFVNSTEARLQKNQPYALKQGDRLYMDAYEIRVSIQTEGRAEPRGWPPWILPWGSL